jgi:hypothetical protein
MTFDDDHRLETYKSMLSIAVEGFKVLLLINGGAVVAMLAYLGQPSHGTEVAQNAWLPLSFFVAGIMACAVTFFSSYWAQLALYTGKALPMSESHKTRIEIRITAGVALFSVILFACGAFSSLWVLTKYSVSAPSVKQAATCPTT